MKKEKQISKEIGWLCFECGYEGGSYGINMICGKCEAKLKYIVLEGPGARDHSTFAMCEKCNQKIRSPVCHCGTKMLPFSGTLEELKNN